MMSPGLLLRIERRTIWIRLHRFFFPSTSERITLFLPDWLSVNISTCSAIQKVQLYQLAASHKTSRCILSQHTHTHKCTQIHTLICLGRLGGTTKERGEHTSCKQEKEINYSNAICSRRRSKQFRDGFMSAREAGTSYSEVTVTTVIGENNQKLLVRELSS